MEIRIRRLSLKDYSAVKMMEKNMLDEYRRELEKSGEKDEALPSIEPKYFKHYVSKEGSFVAETDGMTVGFVLTKAVPFMHGEERIVWMEQIDVLGGFRKEGVGGKLLDAVEDWARRRKMRMLYTTLNTNNEASKRLLVSRGFEVRDWRKASKMLV
jgi:GNAT superfamily N-acetyltransferase